MKTIITILLLPFLGLLHGQSIDQQLISPLGYYNVEGDVHIHYAIGEVAIITHENGITLSEGFYQPVTSSGATSVLDQLDVTVDIYPNPVLDALHLTIHDGRRLDARILDVFSRVVLHESIVEQATIDVSSLNSGTYLIHLQDENKRSKISKFIKI